MSKIGDFHVVGWLGGDYDKLGFFNGKRDAERGICPEETLDEVLEKFKGKSVMITVKVLEEE